MTLILKSCGLAVATLMVAGTAVAGTLSVETGKTIPLRLQGEAASVVLGNNSVADVAVHDKHLLFITGKTFGSTNLLIFDAQGRQIYSADIAVTTNSSSYITVNRSGSNYTYDCAPDCRPVLSIGDNPGRFGALADQNQKLQELAEGQN